VGGCKGTGGRGAGDNLKTDLLIYIKRQKFYFEKNILQKFKKYVIVSNYLILA
jgi:hypothetical protein